MASSASQFLNSCTHHYRLKLGGKPVWCPYWSDNWRRGIRGPHGGKGTPEEITATANQLAKEQQYQLSSHSPDQIRQFMTRHRLGVDCSGFAYYLLNQLLQHLHYPTLDQIISPPPLGNPLNPLLFRCNARCLTSLRHTLYIDFPRQPAQPGDLLRFHRGKHLMIITQVTPNSLTYAHSSSLTQTTGVHFGTITLTNPRQDLSRQHWHELTSDGSDYPQAYFHPPAGDGLRRLKILS
jgi:hypothetical protein